MMDLQNFTTEELAEVRSALNAEIDRREEIERQNAKTELAYLLERVNDLQDEYFFTICCEDDYGNSVSSVSDFALR